MKRKKVTEDTQTIILQDNSLRRCSLCFRYNFDFDIKKGQIAHINRDRSNNNQSNLVFLCLEHHEEYDSKTSTSKGWTEGELKQAKKDLKAFIKKHHKELLPEFISSKTVNKTLDKKIFKKEKRQTITPEIYKLRIPIYNAYRDLVTKILGEAKIDIQDLFEFASKTHEALFLYDEKIADYLSLIFQKGIRLQYLNKAVSNPRLVEKDKWNSIVEEEGDLILWFHDNFEQTRKLFKQYLHFG